MTCETCQKSFSKSRLKKVFTERAKSTLMCIDCRWARIKRIKNGEPIYRGQLPGSRTTKYAMKFGK
jgi:hypothetical protein